MNSKRNIMILFIIGLIIFLIPIISKDSNVNSINLRKDLEDINLPNLKTLGHWDLTGTPININGNAEWGTIAVSEPWCSGSGTWGDPYIIENVTIDGEGIYRCITVLNSDVYFIIQNCTLYNSKDDNFYGGIYMENVYNGTIKNNNCSNNLRSGMWIENCDNITITGNTLTDNGDSGIGLRSSHQNNISFNTIDNSHYAIIEVTSTRNIISRNILNNSWIGVYLSGGNRNNVTYNKIYNNGHSGINFYSHENKIIGNTICYNTQGIFAQHSNLNTVSGNIIYNNTNEGIYFMYCDDGVLSRNNISNNRIGIWLSDQCDNNNFSSNLFNENDNYGIFIEDAYTDSDNNLLFNNSFIKNGINAYDGGTGTYNKWNNTDIGNFWDDYTGIDLNYDGIGEVPYNISGTAGGIDYLPICLMKGPIIIDNDGGGNFTWIEAVNQGFCYGSGSWNNPFILENLIVNGFNSTSCIEIRDSSVYFRIENCNTFNSGSEIDDAGIKLNNVNNSYLFGNNCSNNNGNGIYLYQSQNNSISGNTINNNKISGISLIDSHNNSLISNNDTINNNDIYGIFLSSSHNNIIKWNTINYNKFGIYLNESNYNYVIENTLIGNKKAIVEVNCVGNIIEKNKIPEKYNFPIEIVLMVIIAVIVVSGAVIVKKKVPLTKEKRLRAEKLKKEKQNIKVKNKLHNRLNDIENLMKDGKIHMALKNLNEINAIAKTYKLIDILNEVEKKIEACKKSELETINKIKQTILNLGRKFARIQLVEISEKSGIKDEKLIEDIVLNIVKNKEISGEYFTSSKSLALEVTAPLLKREITTDFNIFLSYSTLDADYFQIPQLVRRLKLYPEINEVLYWQVDSKENIVEFMEETLKNTNVFVLFCSKNAISSKAVKDEWQAAFQLRKEGLMKIVPVYEKEEHIPLLLKPTLNVMFTKDDFEGFIQKLYEEILR